MKKIVTLFTFFLALFLAPAWSFAQDVIFKSSGEEIKAKIVEIEDLKVKYRKFDNLEGPIYNMAKSEILLIRYQNGSIEVFKDNSAPAPATQPAPVQPRQEVVRETPTQTQSAGSVISQFSTPAPAPVYTPSNERSGRFYLAYSPGTFAPLGFSMGSLTDGGGFLLTARFSPNSFGEVSIYEMSDAEGMSDDYWTWNYNGEEDQYRRGSITLAYANKLAGNINGTSLHGYVGLGYGYANYFYSYEQVGQSGTSYGNELVKYTDVSVSSLEFETGLILDLNGFNVNFGYTTAGFTESMLTFGLGLGI